VLLLIKMLKSICKCGCGLVCVFVVTRVVGWMCIKMQMKEEST
jgi:hypothetical protein